MSTDNNTQSKWDRAQEIAESRETYDGEWKWQGEALPLRTEAPSIGELETMEEELQDANNEEVAQAEIVNDYLVKPAVDAHEIEGPKLGALFIGMQQAWSNAVDTSEIEQQLPIESGNR